MESRNRSVKGHWNHLVVDALIYGPVLLHCLALSVKGFEALKRLRQLNGLINKVRVVGSRPVSFHCIE